MWSAVIILTEANLPKAVPYFCMRCRNRLFHVNRDILVMYLGDGYPEKEIPKNMGMVEIKCRGCEYKYSFYFQ
jgi:hypothetical protein